MERSNTYFNEDIARLVEGLPGSEFCPGYVFQSDRAGGAAGASFAWVHEVEIKHEKERQRKLKKTKEAKKKASQLKEKELKRKAREDERETRKRQKVEEEEMKKKAREEERLARLSMQVDQRLFKEACFQREKVVQGAAKCKFCLVLFCGHTVIHFQYLLLITIFLFCNTILQHFSHKQRVH